NGYLHRDKLAGYQKEKEQKGINSFLHEGQRILVQIEKDVTGSKGPRLTEIIELNGEYLVYMPSGNYVAVSKKIQDEHLRGKLRQLAAALKTEYEGLLFRTN